MLLYQKFTLPTTLIRGDKLDIPITVVNNNIKHQDLTLEVTESVKDVVNTYT